MPRRPIVPNIIPAKLQNLPCKKNTPKLARHHKNAYLCADFFLNRFNYFSKFIFSMKNWLQYCSIALLLVSLSTKAQDFVGFNSHPYAGVTSLDVNPANVAGTVYKVDVNLVGASLYANNNYLTFKPKPFYKWDVAQDKSTELNANGVATNFFAQTRVQLPSAMFDINYNNAVALTLQTRAYVQAENVDMHLAKLIYEDFDYSNYWNTNYSAANMKVRAMTWSEIGLGYGHVFYFNGGHRIKVGTRLKYLLGHNSLYLNSNSVSYLFQNDHVMNVNGNFNYGHSTSLGEDVGFKTSGSGFGYDLGVKYSYNNQYILGLALIDGGGLKFDRAVTSSNFSIDQQNWDLNNENVNNIADLDSIIAARGVVSNSTNEYKIGLPTTLTLQATANLWESGDFEGGGYQNLYVNVTSYFDLSGMNNAKDASMKPVPMTTATFGFVSIPIAAGIPVSFGGVPGFQVGGFLRLGPFVLGSKNFLTSLIAKEVRDADIYAALKIPILKPRPNIVKGCPKHF